MAFHENHMFIASGTRQQMLKLEEDIETLFDLMCPEMGVDELDRIQNAADALRSVCDRVVSRAEREGKKAIENGWFGPQIVEDTTPVKF